MNHPLNTLRHELRLHGLCEEIVLDPFSETEVAAYISARSPFMAGDEGFVRALHVRTDGVPLFLPPWSRGAASRVNGVARRQSTRIRLARAGGSGRTWRQSSTAMSSSSPPSGARCSRPRRSAGSNSAWSTVARALGREVVEIADACDQLMREQQWLAVQGARDRERLHRRRRMGFATPSSGRCFMSVRPPRYAPSYIAKWGWRWNRNVPPAGS